MAFCLKMNHQQSGNVVKPGGEQQCFVQPTGKNGLDQK